VEPLSSEFIAVIAISEFIAIYLMLSHENRMATLTIRNLDPALKERLRIQAAEHGHSMEAEARRILQTTLRQPEPPQKCNLYERIRARFVSFGGVEDLEIPPRERTREPPRFD